VVWVRLFGVLPWASPRGLDLARGLDAVAVRPGRRRSLVSSAVRSHSDPEQAVKDLEAASRRVVVAAAFGGRPASAGREPVTEGAVSCSGSRVAGRRTAASTLARVVVGATGPIIGAVEATDAAIQCCGGE
jgi:hypothetical protein